ncbi:hypothetical protein QBC35DRAFT_194105 [Podospora australis]|uniref:CFEM domain-containing protein n=1 Tax=Podospora australis TaxID=1536484 RepID=A0AAN6WIQ7_9PEZI|nr:hypothetical protein QBC35DRAFT_194105 [Podospora australis]
MQLPTIPLLSISLLLASPVLTQRTTNPPCVQDCITKNLASSFCDGDETGAALDKCTCDTYTSGNAGRAASCVKQNCSREDQVVYARYIPTLCRDQFFPGLQVPDASSTGGLTATTGTNIPTGTGSGAGAASSTAAAVPLVGSWGVEQLVAVGGVLVAMVL